MNTDHDSLSLLEAVLDEGVATDRQRNSLVHTLAAVRHERTRKRVVRTGGALLALLFVFGLALLRTAPPRPLPITTARDSLRIIRSQPLPARQWVQTRADSVVTITSSPASVAIISTADAPAGLREIDDRQLLALFADRGAALIRPIGDCLYLMPPLSTPPGRIAEAAETMLRLLGE